MLILAVVVFIGLLLSLVLVHELGHFVAAKRAGCTVEEFGFGFPPRLFSLHYRGTDYSFNLLPIGGFVKIEGEDMADTAPGPGNFAGKSAGWRITILAAGVAMNVLLAVILLTAQSFIGVPTLITDDTPAASGQTQTYILEVAPNSPAAAAGLTKFDRIVRLNDTDQPTIAQIQAVAQSHAGQPVTVIVGREGRQETVQVTPRVNPPAGEGALGISLAAAGLARVPWWQAPWVGITRTGAMIWEIIYQFSLIITRLFTEGATGTTLTGPIGIALYTNEATQLGASYVLEFAALISLNLAIINILPLPALDGGRILFVLIETLRGRRLGGNVEQVTHTIGFAVLILLMIAVTLKDIRNFF